MAFTAIAAGIAGAVQAPFARELRYATFALIVPALLFGVVEEILERLGRIDKPEKSEGRRSIARRLPKPAPISVPAELDPYAKPEKPADETSLTPLGGGALPVIFDRQGHKAIWRVDEQRD